MKQNRFSRRSHPRSHESHPYGELVFLAPHVLPSRFRFTTSSKGFDVHVESLAFLELVEAFNFQLQDVFAKRTHHCRMLVELLSRFCATVAVRFVCFCIIKKYSKRLTLFRYNRGVWKVAGHLLVRLVRCLFIFDMFAPEFWTLFLAQKLTNGWYI